MKKSEMFAYGSAGIAFLSFIFLIISMQGGGILVTTLHIFGAILVFFGAVLAIGFYRYGYILIPLITKHTKTILVTDTGYEIPPSQDVIVKKMGGVYYASVFLGIKIYESMTEKTHEQKILYNEYFERAISNIKFVAKISYLLYVEDVEKKRKMIETKRAEAQLRLQKEKEKPNPDILVIDRYEREVAMWSNELNKLIKGIRPMAAVAYAMTTAVGITKDAAIAKAKSQANELKAVLINSLNVQVEELTGDEMLKAFKWETFIPPTAQDLEESII